MRRLRDLGLLGLALYSASAAEAQTPFTDWSSVIKRNATVAVGGVSQEFTYTSGAGGVTAVAPPSTNMAATFTQTFDPAGDVSSMVIQNANRAVGFYKANGDDLSFIANDRLIYGLSSDWTRKALAADPLKMEWKYQSFGVWVSGLGMAQGSMGAASVGAITPGTSVPQTGSAYFTGLMGGIYNDAVGQDHIVAADMDLAVNFAAHSADFWTTNTKDRDGKAYSDLDITGTFVSLPNHPALFGTLNSQRLTGTSSAQFYGPAAEEVGGVFTMTPKSGQGLERLAGAFGGKRGAVPISGQTTWSEVLVAGSIASASGRSAGQIASPRGQTFLVRSEFTSTPSLVLRTDAGGRISSLAFQDLPPAGQGDARSAAFNAADGSLVSDAGFLLGRSGDGARRGVAVDPRAMGWDYQTFGVWETGVVGAFRIVEAISVGSALAESAWPIQGAATFTGVLGGLYYEGSGQETVILGKATALVDFSARTAGFQSSQMRDRDGRSYESLAISANLALNSGERALVGTARTGATSEGVLSGEIRAQFFGPGAREMGGTFTLFNDPYGGISVRKPEYFTGAFGMKR